MIDKFIESLNFSLHNLLRKECEIKYSSLHDVIRITMWFGGTKFSYEFTNATNRIICGVSSEAIAVEFCRSVKVEIFKRIFTKKGLQIR